MADRRPLTAGLKPPVEIDPAVEKQFVRGDQPDQPRPNRSRAAAAEAREAKGQPPVNRVPFTTRIRGDYAAALKRASLERQLSGETPNTMLDILEEALEPWLRTHGYIE